jgi:hypothetical protein
MSIARSGDVAVIRDTIRQVDVLASKLRHAEYLGDLTACHEALKDFVKSVGLK